MIDFPMMLWMNWPAVNRIQTPSNKFATDVDNKATGVSKLNDSSVIDQLLYIFSFNLLEYTRAVDYL